MRPSLSPHPPARFTRMAPSKKIHRPCSPFPAPQKHPWSTSYENLPGSGICVWWLRELSRRAAAAAGGGADSVGGALSGAALRLLRQGGRGRGGGGRGGREGGCGMTTYDERAADRVHDALALCVETLP